MRMTFSHALRLAALPVLLAAPCLADVPQGQGTGQATAPSAEEVVGWWRMAADQGVANAQSTLGYFYSTGLGVPQDDVAAYTWFTLATAQGDEGSKQQLAKMDKTISPGQKAEAEKRAPEWKAKGK
jgi:uncharacterized protein